jgi:uncharacterized RDD family membrane protein YckC
VRNPAGEIPGKRDEAFVIRETMCVSYVNVTFISRSLAPAVRAHQHHSENNVMDAEQLRPSTDQPIQQKSRPPVGMIILSLFLVYSVYTHVASMERQILIFGPYAIEGVIPTVYNLLCAAAYSVILYAILKRKPWTVNVVLLWFGFLTMQAIGNLILSLIHPSELPSLYAKLNASQYVFSDESTLIVDIAFASVLAVSMNALISWYVFTNRSYFNIDQTPDVDFIDLHQLASLDRVLVKRALAAFLDYALFSSVIFALIYLGYGSFFGTVALWLVYFPGLESVLGYTLFKGLFDLKLVRDNRREFPFMVALKRHLCDPVDFMFFGSVAILTVKLRTDNKRLGDMFAHSRIELEQ